MRTVNELKKLPASELHDAINHDVITERNLKQTELNNDYLERHPKYNEVPQWVLEDSKILALHYTLGGLQALLRIAILDLRDAEAAVERLEDQCTEMLKM